MFGIFGGRKVRLVRRWRRRGMSCKYWWDPGTWLVGPDLCTRVQHQNCSPGSSTESVHLAMLSVHTMSAHQGTRPVQSAPTLCTSSQCITLRTSGFCQLSHQCHQSPRTSTISPIIPVFSFPIQVYIALNHCSMNVTIHTPFSLSSPLVAEDWFQPSDFIGLILDVIQSSQHCLTRGVVKHWCLCTILNICQRCIFCQKYFSTKERENEVNCIIHLTPGNPDHSPHATRCSTQSALSCISSAACSAFLACEGIATCYS